MPSGPKKRKAARRKQEKEKEKEQEGTNPPYSPTTSSSHENSGDLSSVSTSGDEREEKGVNGRGIEQEEEKKEVEAVSVELVKSKEVEVVEIGVEEEKEIVLMSEEVESKAKEVVVSEAATAAEGIREGGEVCEKSGETEVVITQVVAAPLLKHRTSWWNCCGLFDAFAGSKD